MTKMRDKGIVLTLIDKTGDMDRNVILEGIKGKFKSSLDKFYCLTSFSRLN